VDVQIEAVWEARFAEVYSTGVPNSEISHLVQELIQTVHGSNIVGSNLSQKKMKNFMVST